MVGNILKGGTRKTLKVHMTSKRSEEHLFLNFRLSLKPIN